MHRARRDGLADVAIGLLLVTLAACGGGSTQPANVVDEQTPRVTIEATPTGLATEPIPPTGQPSSEAPTGAAGYYTPPGWNGTSDVDCSDFDTREHAQSFFLGTGGTTTNDPHRLDQDHDGEACESLS